MSDKDTDADPARVEPAVAMTNHINQTAGRTEHVNGTVTTSKPSLAEMGRQDSSESIDHKPTKSTFKITSVTLHPQKGSSQDGRHSFGEEDEESAVEDSLVQTDVEDSPAPPSNLAEIVKQQRQDRVDSTSRFKVVKIQKREPYNIGRWRISDFMSEPEINSNKIVQDVPTHIKHSDSGNSSRASSTHYVHGVDDPSKNPLASINISSNPTLPSIQQSPQAPPGLAATVSLAEHTERAVGTAAGPPGHMNNFTRQSDQATDSTSNNNDQLVGVHILTQDPHNMTNASSQPTLVNRVVAAVGQLPVVNSSTPQSQVQQSSDQSSTLQANTQILTTQPVPTSVSSAGAAATVVAAVGSSSDSQSSVTENAPKAPDDVPSTVTAKAAVGGRLSGLPAAFEAHEGGGGGVEALAANLTELVDPSADGEKAEDADAAATGVAIDNKIEQAMDLVKSHLMLAVREEVEELKQQIKQLLEKNSLLEQENKLLRSSAAPETIAQLALLNRQQTH